MNKTAVKKLDLSNEDLELLNSPLGRKMLLADKKTNVEKALRLIKSEEEFHALQAQIIKLQNWVITKNKKVVMHDERVAFVFWNSLRRKLGLDVLSHLTLLLEDLSFSFVRQSFWRIRVHGFFPVAAKNFLHARSAQV